MANDINAVLDESWHAGNRFGKIVPEGTLGDLQNTEKAAGGRVVSAQTVSGVFLIHRNQLIVVEVYVKT